MRTFSLETPLLFCFALLVLAVSGRLESEEPKKAPPATLTREEQTLARNIAEDALLASDLLGKQEKAFMLSNGKEGGKEKLYFAGAQLLPSAGGDDGKPSARYALVTHYRYRGASTITTIVDLVTQKVRKKPQAIPDLPAALSGAEFELAKKLAFADPTVEKALAPYKDKLKIEATVPCTASKEDPASGHRLVHLLFLTDRGYLSDPSVTVDLTTETVRVVSPK